MTTVIDRAIDVVVVTHNSAHVVEALLESLPRALDGLEARVVVVDNGSTDNTLGLLRARSDCTVVAADNRGYAAGINRGVEALDGSGPILVLNPDVRLAPGCVAPLVRALETAGVGIAAPRVLDDDGRLFLSMRREPTLRRALGLGRSRRPALSERVDDPASYESPQTVDWALGAALLVSRECHLALGGWDESFFLYSEETDFCLRARDRGWATRYEPASVVHHIGGQSGQSPRIHAMQIVNRVRLYRRRHAWLPSLCYFLLSIASELSWLVRGRRRSITALSSLVLPWTRPVELACSSRLIPH